MFQLERPETPAQRKPRHQEQKKSSDDLIADESDIPPLKRGSQDLPTIPMNITPTWRRGVQTQVGLDDANCTSLLTVRKWPVALTKKST